MEDETNSAIDALGMLLEPLGKTRQKVILGWVKNEIRTRTIVQYVYERGAPLHKIEGVEVGGPQIWQLGQPSPLNGAETIFAMFLDDETRSVTVYTYTLTEVDGGAQALHFFSAVLFDLIHVHGPVHHDALLSELGSFLTDDEELAQVEKAIAMGGDQAPANGASS